MSVDERSHLTWISSVGEETTGDPPNGGDPPFEEPPREGDVTSDDWCERADGGRATAADFGARGSSAMMTVSRCCGFEVSVGVVEGSQSL